METILENHIDAGVEEMPRLEDPTPAAAPMGATVPGSRLAWENYLRCLFLLVVVFFLGLMTWRNGSARFSLLLSLANPSLGESLAWKPAVESPSRPAAPKRVRPPEEWRLGSRYAAQWRFDKPEFKRSSQHATALASAAWRRFSANPWNWHGDAGEKRRMQEDDMLAAQPPQKPASSFRVGDAVWPTTPAQPSPATSDALAAIPALPPLSGSGTLSGQTTAFFPSAPAALPGFQTMEEQATPQTAPPGAAAMAGPGFLPPPTNPADNPLRPLASLSATPAPAAVPSEKAEQVDWRNREITGPIPGAFLTIYPKLKFIGLCLPGQGYIRKYNQVGVPSDSANPKMEARDGRTPYGRYYIADRHRDADGARLFLSWPSPEDARRIGLDAGRLAQIDNAWRLQELPPQNTAAGGGVGLTGLRNWVETTEGGFSLEEPQMEEIFTALPDKAWVFIQP